MRITSNDLTVDSSGFSEDDLLSAWRWLVGESMRLLLVSALGDMFLLGAQGRVHWLDVGSGHLKPVANDVEEFGRLMQQGAQAEEWFVPQLVEDLISAGIRLGPGECYSYRVPPVLGGTLEPSNLKPTDLSVHFSVLGQIHEQVKDLPPGAKIGKVEFK